MKMFHEELPVPSFSLRRLVEGVNDKDKTRVQWRRTCHKNLPQKFNVPDKVITTPAPIRLNDVYGWWVVFADLIDDRSQGLRNGIAASIGFCKEEVTHDNVPFANQVLVNEISQ